MSDPLLEKAREPLRRHREKDGRRLAQLFDEGQRPHAFLITCADSRVLPEQMLGLAPGQYFILRNVANIVPPHRLADSSFSAALEFAHFSLGIPHIVICGHTDCGGLLALSQGLKNRHFQALSSWLALAQTTADLLTHPPRLAAQADAILDRPAAHVIQQLANLRTYPFIIEALKHEQVTLHGWVYDLRDASVHVYHPDEAIFTRFKL